VRMNPDLAMGDELLKKTGTGNLFTVFGEPDVKLERKDGKVVVTIRGVDVFDPTTGAVRSGGVDDIACWFLDTDYDGQSFFDYEAVGESSLFATFLPPNFPAEQRRWLAGGPGGGNERPWSPHGCGEICGTDA